MDNVVSIWAASRAQLMPASELVYFHGAHLQHIVDYEEHRRLERIRKQSATMMRDRRRNGRAIFTGR